MAKVPESEHFISNGSSPGGRTSPLPLRGFSCRDEGWTRVDQSSESGTSFREGGTSLEDVVMRHVAHIPYGWNAGSESERLERCDVFRRHP
jgi:hypothetical protein